MNPPAPDLDAMLSTADPAASGLEPNTLTLAAELADATRADVLRGSWFWRRPRLWVGVFSAAVLVAGVGTGAAFASGVFDSWRVHFSVDGQTVDKVVEADVVIPLTWTTRSGTQGSCTWAWSYSWGETSELAAFVASHDWSALGQRAYDYNLAHPHYPERVTSTDDQGNTTELTPEEIRAAGPVFSHAIQTMFDSELPANLRDNEYISTGQTDCDGAEQ